MLNLSDHLQILKNLLTFKPLFDKKFSNDLKYLSIHNSYKRGKPNGAIIEQ